MASGASVDKSRFKKDWTSQEILELWKIASQEGLKTKKFMDKVSTKYEKKLMDAIEIRFKKYPDQPFNDTDKQRTEDLAHALGCMCRVMTAADEIDEDTFKKAFKEIKQSPMCPPSGKGPRGAWCDIDI